MGFLDIIYNMVNKSGSKTKTKKSSSKKKTKKKKPSPKETKKTEKKIIIKDLKDTKALLDNWQDAVQAVGDHPLSQAKIINDQLLGQLTDVLLSMNKKMDKLDKLDDILVMLKESRSEIRIVGGSTKKLDKAISALEGLTVKDEEVIKVLNSKGPQTAEGLGRLLGVSRSTASSRLNRLKKLGVVRKKADGKLIFYSLYSQKKG